MPISARTHHGTPASGHDCITALLHLGMQIEESRQENGRR
jgi:hypothetical protein